MWNEWVGYTQRWFVTTKNAIDIGVQECFCVWLLHPGTLINTHKSDQQFSQQQVWIYRAAEDVCRDAALGYDFSHPATSGKWRECYRDLNYFLNLVQTWNINQKTNMQWQFKQMTASFEKPILTSNLIAFQFKIIFFLRFPKGINKHIAPHNICFPFLLGSRCCFGRPKYLFKMVSNRNDVFLLNIGIDIAN